MSDFQNKFNTLVEKTKMAQEISKFNAPRTPVGRTGRLDHAFVEGVIKTTIIYATDEKGEYIPDGLGGYVIDYIASNQAREAKYEAYDKALSAPSEYDQWASNRAARLAGRNVQS